jgi:class 3 adenylate cyclase
MAGPDRGAAGPDRAMEGPDRVLATVLFTDIVGSTERLAELGDRGWRELLREHHARVREELQRFGGREINTAGDGFLAAFDGLEKRRSAAPVRSGTG